MGRPRGKLSNKPNDGKSDEDGIGGGGGGEEVSVCPTPPPTKTKRRRRRGRPAAAQKPLTLTDDDGTGDDVEGAEDDNYKADAAGDVKVEEDDADDGAKPAPAVRPAGGDDAKASTAETGGAGKKRRRRRVKRGSDDDRPVGEEEEDGVGEGHVVRGKSGGFRPNGSRRKNTPRRAAEAGVECK